MGKSQSLICVCEVADVVILGGGCPPKWVMARGKRENNNKMNHTHPIKTAPSSQPPNRNTFLVLGTEKMKLFGDAVQDFGMGLVWGHECHLRGQK